MKIGLAQLNTTVGDLAGNLEKVSKAYFSLVEVGAELVVFPELVLCGYPPRDLLFKSRFVPDNLEILDQFAAITGSVPAVVGYVEANLLPRGRRFYNSAAWCADGSVHATARKCLLPTYDVFDEDRYFEASIEASIIPWKNLRVGITICEDIWTGPVIETSRHYKIDPLAQLEEAGVDLVLNLSASPWHSGKEMERQDIVRSAAKRAKAPVVYVNAIGGNDELIFDGHSLVARADGSLKAALPGFAEALEVVDLSEASARPSSLEIDQPGLGDVEAALVLGLRDYAHKSGFQKGLIGLSGGIDSAVTAAIAVKALGKENVIGISLPSAISSQHSRDDAKVLADKLGLAYYTLPIESIVQAAEGVLGPVFEGRKADVTEENIQARSRGLLLMAVSNKFGALLLTTGNKSEIAVGYCTLYGDMAGGLAVISDLPKTQVFELARWMNRDEEVIPWNTIEKPPSAELRPGQKDEDSLPPYPILDDILKRYIELGQSSREIIEAGFSEEMVRDIIRKVDLNEYKRKQAAPGLKTTPLAFGVGRRIPLVQKYIS